MKVDTNSINHNIVLCIKELCLSDYAISSQVDINTSQYLIGYIDGLITLGESLKDVLKE